MEISINEKIGTMKKFLLSAGMMLAIACTFAGAQNESEFKTATFNVEQFDKINLGGAYEVEYEMTEGDAYVEVSGPQKILDILDVRVKNGELKIDVDKKLIKVNLNGNVKVKAFSKTLSSVQLAGACNFSCDKGLMTDNFEAQLSGTGNIEIVGLDALAAKLAISGAGNIKVKELEADDLDVRISGAGSATLTGEAKKAVVNVSGAGGADIRDLTITESLDTKMAGIGKIKR